MNLNNFVVKFKVSYINEELSVKFSYPASQPTSTDIINEITELENFVKSNGITLSNYSPISISVESITTKLSSMSSNYSSDVKSISTSSTSKEALLQQLQNIKTKLMSDQNVSETKLVTPDDETGNTPPPSMTNSKRNTSKQDTTKVTTNKTIGQLVTELQNNSTKSNNNFSTFVSKVKSAFGTKQTTNNTTSSSSQIVAGSKNDNIFYKLADSIVNRRGLTGKNLTIKKKPTTTSSENNINELLKYQPDKPSEISTTTDTVVSSDSYEIETTVNNNYLQVTYAYYKGGETNSSKAFTFNLLPGSLISLSLKAYTKAKTLSNSDKVSLLISDTTSSIPTDSELWNGYLLWLFSYLSTGVGSQLYDTDIKEFPSLGKRNAVNYMMGYSYMNSVGNIGLTLQSQSLDTQQQVILSVSIPHEWPSLMYGHENDHTLYIAQSIVSMIKNETSTS